MDEPNLEERVNNFSLKRFDWKGLLVLTAMLIGAYYAWNYGMDCTFKNKYIPPAQKQESIEHNEENNQQQYLISKYTH